MRMCTHETQAELKLPFQTQTCNCSVNALLFQEITIVTNKDVLCNGWDPEGPAKIDEVTLMRPIHGNL